MWTHTLHSSNHPTELVEQNTAMLPQIPQERSILVSWLLVEGSVCGVQGVLSTLSDKMYQELNISVRTSKTFESILLTDFVEQLGFNLVIFNCRQRKKNFIEEHAKHVTGLNTVKESLSRGLIALHQVVSAIYSLDLL